MGTTSEDLAGVLALRGGITPVHALDGTLIATDPLTPKGNEIKSAMTKEYGEKKGEKVFYASKNKGTISGVDEMDDEVAGDKGRWGGRARDCDYGRDALTDKVLDKLEGEKEGAHKDAPKNAKNIQPATGRWGGRARPHVAKDGGHFQGVIIKETENEQRD